MLCAPASTWGHAFSRTSLRIFGIANAMPTTIAAPITRARISLPMSRSVPPISDRLACWPTANTVIANIPSWVIVPEMPTSTPDEVAAPTSTPCFWRKRMFMIVEAAPVVARRFANETAICRKTAGSNGIGWLTEPIVVNANATLVDWARRKPTTSQGQSAVLSVSTRSLRLPTCARISHSASSERAEHHEAERPHTSELDRLHQVAVSCLGDHAGEPVEEVFVGAERSSRRRRERGLWSGSGNAARSSSSPVASLAIFTVRSTSSCSAVVTSACAMSRSRRCCGAETDPLVEVDDHRAGHSDAHVLAVERAVSDAGASASARCRPTTT